MQEELVRLEEFSIAIVQNDFAALDRILAADWVIVDADGGITTRSRFVEAIQSGALTHAAMESNDISVRIYGDSAVVTALTMTKGNYRGREFSTRERSTDVFVKQDDGWKCVLTHLTRFAEK